MNIFKFFNKNKRKENLYETKQSIEIADYEILTEEHKFKECDFVKEQQKLQQYKIERDFEM